MQNTALRGPFAIGVALIILGALAVLISSRAAPPTPAPEAPLAATSTEAAATTTAPATSVVVKPFPINAADTLLSWNFAGAYAGNATLTQQANADITHLTDLAGGGKYDDYDLYNGIANDYTSLGNGAAAYQYYNRSIRIYPNKGLAYANLAHLMSELGAYHTAADAYAKAVSVEPGVLEYHIERLAYLTRQFPKDNALVLAAFADASKQFGDAAPILSIEAEWLESLGRYADAVKAWQTVKILSPADRQAAIDAQIARDQAKK